MTQASIQDSAQTSTENIADDDWNIFNFHPLNEDYPAECNENQSEQDTVDRFFTELPLKLAGIGLTDKRSDIYKLLHRSNQEN